MIWQLRRPHRWFNQLLFYVGWLALLVHLGATLWCWWQSLSYPLSWWFTALAPALCVLWGGVPALQLQPEAKPKPTGVFHS
jgi:hypothetical protein